MSLSLCDLRKAIVYAGLALAVPLSSALGQSSYTPNGSEYAIAGALPTDQVRPRAAINQSGGFLVWEDTRTDGEGLGVSAVRLGSGLAANLSSFRVNQVTAEDQERPVVALLKNGGAVFAWQGGRLGFQRIYARFLKADNTWATGDIRLSSPDRDFQIYPSVSTLANGNVVVVWGSYNQVSSSSMQDVYAQILTPDGEKVGGEFLVNQFTTYNQRTPVVAALSNGGFVVVWISEQQRTAAPVGDNPGVKFPSVDVFARIFNSDGTAAGGEFLVNTSTRVCANPSVAAGDGIGFIVGWGEKDADIATNSWDVFTRVFSNTGVGGNVSRASETSYGEQFAIQLAATKEGYLAVWNSLGQDGSMEGVYGRFLKSDGTAFDGEFQVNTTTVSKQMHPAVASDRASQSLVVWTSFVGGERSFDLFAQRYTDLTQPLPRMDAPFVHVPFGTAGGVYQPAIQVSWALQEGLAVDHYEVYASGSIEPIASVSTNFWAMTTAHGLKPSSTVSFQVLFVTADGRKSPVSASSSGTTWSGYNWGGIPFEWMTASFGSDMSSWPGAAKDLETGGPSVLQTFLSGGNPNDPATWLRTSMVARQQGVYLNWNPRPGLIYQVQKSSNLLNWENVGGPRLAVGAQDSIPVGNEQSAYYRVVLLR